MSDQSAIGWTDATWNCWSGCTKVSPGCAHCYAERLFQRWGRDFATVTRAPDSRFTAPLHWRKPRMVFTCSMSDFFHEAADAWRAEAWDVIRQTPRHTYQILTKRPERIRDHLPPDWGEGWPHVWLGVSVENQRHSGRAFTLIRDVSAPVLFLSCEPLLGPLDLTKCHTGNEDWTCNVLPGVDWVIVGGESGDNRRDCAVHWIEDIVAQCEFAGVPCFVKQDSHRYPGQQGRLPDDVWRVKQFPEPAHA